MSIFTGIRSFYRGEDKTTVVRIGPPSDGNTYACGSEKDLRTCPFFAGLTPAVREELREVYRDADGREEELYDLRSDPGEKKNVVGEYPEQAERFRDLIRQRVESDREALPGRQLGPGKKAPVTGEMRERLRALGYLN